MLDLRADTDACTVDCRNGRKHHRMTIVLWSMFSGKSCVPSTVGSVHATVREVPLTSALRCRTMSNSRPWRKPNLACCVCIVRLAGVVLVRKHQPWFA